MGEPDIINAFLGATVGSGVVGPFIEKVLEGLKFVYHCKEECTALREYLEKIKPLLLRISDGCKTDSEMKKWLDVFEKCVMEADEIVKICSNDNSIVWNRAYEVKYGGVILKLRDEISENVGLSSMAHLSLQSGITNKSKAITCGTVQQVPNKIFGMKDHFKRVKSSIIEGHASKSSSCVGIQGMGGGGKTLLAQMVNNDKDIQDLFGRTSILWITVGHEASIPIIYELMRNCLDGDAVGGSLEDQRTHLRNEFLRRKVLLILDDVWDNVYEYKEMVEWLNIAEGVGSVTLITTRMESVTRCVNGGVEIILLLSEKQSWELFCTHAFGTDKLPLNKPDLVQLAKVVCKECKCLPLALKVIGLAMRDKCDIAEWQSILKRLQKSSMINKSVDDQLFARLRISYDELDKITKICFLYFAAFPEDCKIPVKHLCEIWVVEALFGEDLEQKEAMDEAWCALNELRRRCLIDDCRYNDENCVKMHDILRDIAIHMTRDGEECARESLFMLNRKDLEEFPTSWLRLPFSVKRMSLWGNKFKRFSSNFKAPYLKICILCPNSWEVRNSNSQLVPNSQECIIEEEFFKQFINLRYFQLCWNQNLQKLPESIGGLGFLQHLNLEGCDALKELPESIGGLGSLQHLNLGRCDALKELPESIGRLGSLQHLNLQRCRALKELPESIGRLGSLQHLNLQRCRALKELPESIGGLGSLQHLNLGCCYALKELPESIGGLGSLQHLNLGCCYALKELPESIGGLGSLQHLNLRWCDALKELPESIGGLGSLQHHNLCDCCALKELTESIGGLGFLQHLNLECCLALKELPESIGGLGSLQHLNLECCRALKELPESIGGLGSLQQLNVRWCDALKELPESIGGLGSLQHLNLGCCRALKELPESIGGLGSLQHLNLQWCDALKELPESIGGLGSLQHLNLEYCRALKELLESIGGLGSLQHLNLRWCNALKELPESIGGLGSLQHLNLFGCDALKELPESIGGMGSLQYLNLECCRTLKELPKSIGGLGSLQHLNLRWCDALKELPESIGRLGSLQHLNLECCRTLKELLESIRGLGSLQHLNLRWCDALKELPESIGGLGSLQHLNLQECRTLKELPESIGGLGSLQHLNLGGCRTLKYLPESIGGLGSLQYLNLFECYASQEHFEFTKIPRLRIDF